MNLSKNLNINFLNNNKSIYLFLLLISLISRIITSFFFGDRVLENEWAILVSNLYNFKTLSMLNFDGLLIPNLWMPPFYAYFIYLHTLIFGMEENLANYVIATQVIISSFTTIIFYKIISRFFNFRTSILGAILFSLFPLIVFSACQISSASLYLFFLLTFILLILNLSSNDSANSIKNLLLIGFLSGILILTRRDFILIYFFSLFYSILFFRVSLKRIVLVLIITSITISPYVIRNYLVFDKFIVHSGFGYNLWKAYNPNAKVEGYYMQSDELKSEINKVKKDIFYRINEDKIYSNEARKFIIENPEKSFSLFSKRLFSFYFIDFDSSQKNYYNYFHTIPNLLVSILSLIGFFIFYKKDSKFNYLICLFLIILAVYSLFALLPRYKIYILPFQIILSLNLIEFLSKKLSKNY